MTIVHLLEKNAKEYAGDTALVEINPEQPETRKLTWAEYELVEPTPRVRHYRREITWAVFNEKANRLANMLQQNGIGKGKKVAILLMNCIDWLPIYFGILKTGALAVPLNFRYSSDEIDYCLDLAEADVLIFGTEFIGRVEAVADKLSKRCTLIYLGAGCPAFADDYNDLISECSGIYPECTLEESDDAAIYFSSGTTGFPKAILHKHQSLIHSCRVEQMHHGQTKEDCFLCIPPLYHTGAKMHWFGSLITGSKAVILKGTQSRNILKAVSEEKCTIVWLLVPWAQDILNAMDRGELDPKEFELSQWRLMHIGAQPVPQSLIKRWLEYFPDQQYDTNYGLSESIGPGAVHLGVENVHKVGAIGVPGYGWEIKIMADGKEVTQGEVGELCLKGPGVMTCYYRDKKATAEALKDGWLYTGDMAMQDEDGFVYLVDRKKDVIITGGENLYPVQIENFLSAHPKIKDVAVIGLPDSRLGEIATAIIEIKQDMTCTEEEINEFCLDLPRYKRPRKIIFADVPRNPTGKIEKPKLRKIYGAEGLVASQNKS